MMSILEWLLGLDGIRLERDAPLLWRWQNPYPPWIVFVLVVAVTVGVFLIYRMERGSALRRTLLGVIRIGIIMLAAAILFQPAIVLQRNRTQHSFVALAWDVSGSMATKDVYRDKKLAQHVAGGAGVADVATLRDLSRSALLQRAWRNDDDAPALRLLQHNDVQVWPFAESASPAADIPGAYRDANGAAQLVSALEATKSDGQGTDLTGALEKILTTSSERRLSAIVVASDGHSTQPSRLRSVLDQARQRRIPIFPIRLGSPYRPRDVAVRSVRSRGSVFVNDMAAIDVDLEAFGTAPTDKSTLRIADIDTGEVLASRTIEWKEQPTGDDQSVSIKTEVELKVTREGTMRFRAELEPFPDETVIDNNVAEAQFTVLDNHLRVLYVDAYPRYEYRYLKNALVREKNMDLSVLLLEADEAFVQEGTLPIRRFPQTAEELNLYDVVLFGDVDPSADWLSPMQMNLLAEFVGRRGGGFGVIAGQRSAPQDWLGTPLEKLVPVQILSAGYVATNGQSGTEGLTGFQPVLTEEGRRSSIFRHVLQGVTKSSLEYSIRDIYWFAPSGGPKPGAAVLLEHPTVRTTEGAMPIVVTSRFGAGKIFYQATDDTWLWRREDGELFHDAYWVQVVRDLARGNRLASDRRLILRTDRRIYPYGGVVQAVVEFLDPALLAVQGDQVVLTFHKITLLDANSDRPFPAPESETEGKGTVELHRAAGLQGLYDGTWIPPDSGAYALSFEQPGATPDHNAPTIHIQVQKPNLESRRPEANHDVLERIAKATDGQVLDLDGLAEGFDKIKDRSVQVPDDIVEPIWDSKLALMMFVLMISVEWVVRKSSGLL